MSEVKDYLKLPSLSPLPHRHFWVVNEEWVCYGHTVPRGFVTDLDSVPTIPVLYALIKGRSRWAALLHDFLYSGTTVDRKTADLLFHRAMLEEGVPPVVAKCMYWAVRGFGWRYYNKQRKIPSSERLQRRIADYTGEAPCFTKTQSSRLPNV